MENFYYNFIRNKYGVKAEMLLTDTDSLMYIIETDNIYEDLCKDKELFGISNYQKNQNITIIYIA